MDDRSAADAELGRLSEAEALMWRVEADPWLSSTVGVVAVLDRPVDFERLARRLAAGIAASPRLRARVVADGRPGGALRWAPDDELDLDHHLSRLGVPAPGGERQLLDLAVQLVAEPFDRTRPLWRIWAIDRLRGGRGGIVWKLHHSLTDGFGALRLAEQFVDGERDPAGAAELDPSELRALSAADATEADSGGEGAAHESDPIRRGLDALRAVSGWQLDQLRRLAGDALLVGADPGRLKDAGVDALADVQRVVRQLIGQSGAGSTLWARRSRRRSLEVVKFPLEAFRATARSLGGTVNDLFVATAVQAAVDVHAAHGEEPEHLGVSFIVSTRRVDTSGGNAFLPVRIEVPVAGLDPLERFRATQAALAEHRDEARDDGLMHVLLAGAGLLPTGVATRIVRQVTAGIDLATSSLRGPDFPLYVGGSEVRWAAPLGPLAGTPANLTALTYAGQVVVGIHADPEAVGDPAELAAAVRTAFRRYSRLARPRP